MINRKSNYELDTEELRVRDAKGVCNNFENHLLLLSTFKKNGRVKDYEDEFQRIQRIYQNDKDLLTDDLIEKYNLAQQEFQNEQKQM